MDLPLQITLRGLDRSDALEAAVRSRADKLQRFYRHIGSCRVVIERPERHHRHGRQFIVRLDIKVPGGEIAINREHDEDALLAVHDAFDAARRRLQDHARMQRGDVKPHSQA